MPQDIAQDFNKYFRMIPANTSDLLDEVYKLRYQVYCLETGFEAPENCPGERERDDFDDQSEHYLIQHKETGTYAATTRLILPNTANLDRLFPIEQHSRFDQTDILQPIARNRLAEVSRFCVSKEFKRRQGEQGTIAGIPSEDKHPQSSEDERRTFPLITLALIAGLVRMNAHHGITHWYSVMEPALIRFLRSIGIHFTPIGPSTEYHGIRTPCIIEVQYLLDGVKEKNQQAWNLLTDYGRFSKI